MNKNEPIFLTEDDLDRIVGQRPVVLFGAGHYGEKTLNLMKRAPAFCVDNNPAKQGQTWKELAVKEPDALKAYRRDHPDAYVVICVEAYRELTGQLADLGLVYGESCGISPVERDLLVLDLIKNHHQTVLFSNYDTEGGLYVHDFARRKTEKVRHGPVRGFVRVGDALYCCTTRGLAEVDAKTYEDRRLLDLSDYNVCGITHDPDENLLMIGGTQRDDIIVVDAEKLAVKRRLSLSAKYKHFGRESHHINDLLVVGNYILTSMFSRSGWWRYGIFDGGVLEIDKNTGEINRLQTANMWMPHSLKMHDDHLYILDSMNGRLIRDLHTEIATFNGFMRGMDMAGDYAYVGQSENRHVSRMKERSNTSVDSGIHILDMKHHVSRMVHVEDCTNIYQVLVLGAGDD